MHLTLKDTLISLSAKVNNASLCTRRVRFWPPLKKRMLHNLVLLKHLDTWLTHLNEASFFRPKAHARSSSWSKLILDPSPINNLT